MPWLLLIAIPIALVVLFRVELWIQKRKTERARVRWIEHTSAGPKSVKQSKQLFGDNRKAAKRWTGVDL